MVISMDHKFSHFGVYASYGVVCSQARIGQNRSEFTLRVAECEEATSLHRGS